MKQSKWNLALMWNSLRQSRNLLPCKWMVGFLLLGGAAAGAQTTSVISGVVTDTSGADVVGAAVTATNTGTAVEYHGTTDGQGAYHITQLPPGTYTVKVISPGFSTQELLPFPLLVAQQSEQNITLSVGRETQSVSVSAASLLIDTESSNQGQVIGNQQIEDLPLNGRDYLQLAQLSAGVTPIISGFSSPASQWTSSAGNQTVSVAIAGLREDDNSYLYDGIETRNAWYGAEGLLPSTDNIQEFKVEQSGAPASYAGGGAFINVVTRSGTNDLHGSVYEYLRNNDLDARNYFDQGAAPPFHQNQFGATLGGPVKKNKVFFFLNYEGFRLIQPNDEFSLVPTQNQLAGNFSADTKQLVNPYTNMPYANNQIPTAQFNSVGQKIAAYYPAPNGSYSGGTTNYFNVADTTIGWDQESARVDYQISNKDSIFGRITNQSETTTQGDITPSRTIIFPSNPKNLVIGWTHVFNPNLVNNFRYGWTHTATGEQRADGYNAAQANPLGLINEADQPGSYGPPSFGVTGYANPGSTEGTDIVREGLNQWTDNISLQKGKQQISAGADIRYEPIYLYEDWAATSLSFNGVYTGDPVADLLLGVPDSGFTAIGDPLLNLRMWYQSYYAQDNVKINNHLSVIAGLNYQHISEPIDTANHVGSFNVATGQDLTYPNTNSIGLGRNMVNPKFLNFAPRLGFNYTPFNEDKTDIMGGCGVYFLQPNINQYEVEVDTTQYYLIQSYNNTTPVAPTTTTPGQFVAPSFTLNQLFGPSVPGGGPTASFVQPNGPTPYTYEWNLTLDHTVKSWLLEAVYLGSAAHHYEERPNIAPLETLAPMTAANPTKNATIGTRYTVNNVTPFNGVQENTTSGSSTYNGIVFRVEHRYSNGFEVLGNYTFSKCLGYPYQDEFTWHPLNLRLDRSHCDTDLNQNLVANAIYELPFGQGKAYLNNGTLLNQLVGGWKVATIASFHSGPWLTLGSSQNLGIFVNALPDVTGPVNNVNLHGGLGRHQRLGPYFNTQNVTNLTGEAVQGNTSPHNVEGPGAADWDISAFKKWSYRERYGLEFQAQAFNAFNRVNFTGLDTGVADPRFGQVTTADAPRQIQLSLRATF